MIVQIAGTNGSGKTTAVRTVIAQMRELSTLVVRGKEYGKTYHLQEDEERGGTPPLVFVMGRYGEAATGGCDRLSDVKSIRPVIAEQVEAGLHVVFEGIRMVNHTDGVLFCRHQVGMGTPYHVVLLTTTLEECLEGIRARQVAATGTTRDVVVRDIASTITRNRNYAAKLREVGARLHRASRAEAPGVVIGLLRGEVK